MVKDVNPDRFATARANMVEQQLRRRGIKEKRVLEVMGQVRRELFMPERQWPEAYADRALPVGHGQTISQPLMVAIMTEALELKGGEKVLEIGTGNGYQTVILAQLAAKVFTIERVRELGRYAERLFEQLELFNILVRIADGTHGWSEEAPFDAILVTAGAPEVPKPYLDQLKIGGRLVQTLYRYIREKSRVVKENCGQCRFVPLIGHYGWKEKDLNIH